MSFSQAALRTIRRSKRRLQPSSLTSTNMPNPYKAAFAAADNRQMETQSVLCARGEEQQIDRHLTGHQQQQSPAQGLSSRPRFVWHSALRSIQMTLRRAHAGIECQSAPGCTMYRSMLEAVAFIIAFPELSAVNPAVKLQGKSGINTMSESMLDLQDSARLKSSLS